MIPQPFEWLWMAYSVEGKKRELCRCFIPSQLKVFRC